ncbi:unnamed protein product [Effrenium voratum]|nr:unnamed protein product [Effrenium voratum]
MDSRQAGLLLILLLGLGLVAWNAYTTSQPLQDSAGVAPPRSDGLDVAKLAPGQSIAYESMSPALKAMMEPLTDVVVLRPWPAPHWLHVVSASAKDPATRELRTRKLRDCPLTLLTQWAFDEGCVEDFSVVIDIGMNLGWFTALAAAHGLQVVAFEPSAAKVKYMAKTLELNGWDKVQLRHGGLATEGGQLFVDETRWWEKRSASREAGEGKTEATALRLDDVVSSSAKVCLLKADCRGCETEAFRSGERLLQAGAVQVVQMEYDHSEASRTALETLQSMSPRPWQCILLPTGLSCSGGDLADQKSEALQELWDFVVANAA